MIDIKEIPNKIKELNSLYDYLVGLNIKSTVDFSEIEYEEKSPYTWTYIYKYDHEAKSFKVNHNGMHFYMREEEMWEIIENSTEVKKD